MKKPEYIDESSGGLFVAPSKIGGFGLFSKKAISNGDIAGRLCGVILPVANRRTIQIGRGRHLCSDYIDFLNHCCRPNAYIRVEGDSIALNAIQDINAEAEITVDYNCSEYRLAESFTCRCCQRAKRICGYSYLVETCQHDYLRRIDRFLLPHLLDIPSESKGLSTD